MEKYTIDPMIAAFRDAVLRDAAAERKERSAAIAARRKDALRHAKKDAAKQARDLVAKQTADIRSEVNRALVAKRFEAKKTLLRRRMEIRDEVTASVTARIRAFTETPEYIEGLKRMIRSADLDMLSDKVTVFLPAKDPGVRALMESYLPDAAFEIDKNIRLGGCRIRDRKKEIVLDFTIDTGFETAMERFLEISKLSAEM